MTKRWLVRYVKPDHVLLYMMIIIIKSAMAEAYLPLARPLFLTTRKSSPSREIQCHYCQLKQKFSGEGQKCFEHTITDNQHSPLKHAPPDSEEETLAEQIVGLMEQAEQALEDYWNNLYQHSQGSPQKARSELASISAALRSLQDTFSRFPQQNPPSPTPPSQNRIPQQQRKLATRSQKFITSNFSELFQEPSLGEQIKEWVLHFQRILVSREIKEDPLPLEDEVDMRIFKQSMERRFLSFAKGYQKYQQRTAEALQRLLFYMQQFGGQISQEQFKQDLQFLQQGEQQKIPQDDQMQRYMLIQAMTIQHLLAQKQMEAQAQLAASRRSRQAQLDYD